MDLLQGLEAFFDATALCRGDWLLVGFSGGGDSTALLWGLLQLAPRWRIDVVAAHLDHGMDPGSTARALRAGSLARRLGVPLVSERRPVSDRRKSGESLEAAARRIRYDFLEEARCHRGARYVATAHHREDQAETVLLRMAGGSGLRGLAGIRPVAGTVVRPLLSLPRSVLRSAVAAAGLEPIEDPGNADPRQPRSRMRHQILPALAAGGSAVAIEPLGDSEGPAGLDALIESLARLAARAQRAVPILDRRLAAAIEMQALPAALPDATAAAASRPALVAAASARLAALPEALMPHALALLHQAAGAPYPASRAAAGELRRQLQPAAGPRRITLGALPPGRRTRAAPRVACDCGGGWQWVGDGASLQLRRARPGDPCGHGEQTSSFSYTLELPGELTVPEIAVQIRVSESPVEAWMWQGAPHRAGLVFPLAPGAPAAGGLTVRNRRAGDRLRPLGSPGSRKLKEVLIDRGVPKWQRDRLPLLCWAGEIAWVPGVTIDHRFRLGGQSLAWVAEVIPHGSHRPTFGNPCRRHAVHDCEEMSQPRGAEAPGRRLRRGAPCEVAQL